MAIRWVDTLGPETFTAESEGRLLEMISARAKELAVERPTLIKRIKDLEAEVEGLRRQLGNPN